MRFCRTSHATMSPRSDMAAAIAVVFPPGDAQQSRTRSPAWASDQQRDELRRLVLDDEPAGVDQPGRVAQRLAGFDDERVGRKAAGRRPGCHVAAR